jgi:starch-binding outer membrane protein, SusD/RagB family
MKKYNSSHKIITLAILFITMILPSSCNKDVLEEKIISNIGNDYLNTPAGLNDGVKAAYASLRSWYGSERGCNLTVFGTDTYQNGADGNWKFMNTYDPQFDPRTGIVQEVWDEFYRGINTCNAVIDRAAKVAGLTDVVKKQRIGEVKFLRANYYFILTQLFGGVDLRLKETIDPTKAAKRATIQEMYAAITKDLEDAIVDLENKARSVEYGRATKAAAEHLLAKVYLTKGTSEAKAADDFSKAATLANNVIKNYGIELLPDFADVHKEGNETNKEVIFACQYTYDPLTNLIPGNPFNSGNNSHVFFLMEYDVLPGMIRDIVNGRPFKRYKPTTYTLETVFALSNRVNDSRYYKTFKDTHISNNAGTFNSSAFDDSKTKVTFAVGDTAFYQPGFEMSKEERATKKYQVMNPSKYSERWFPGLRKHIDGRRADRTVFEGGRDFIAMRLGETYLILAEALIKQDKNQEAADAVNVLRRRAAWAGKQTAMEITAAQANMDFMYEERERELIGEQHRWFDLKRWGNLVARVKLHNSQATATIKDYHVLRPIPQVQIDRVEGGKASFPQNPGY